VFPTTGRARPYVPFPPVGDSGSGLTLPQVSGQPAGLNTESALSERGKLPGLLGHMETDSPGMHTTDTIDFEYVISGEVWLELDDGKEVHLGLATRSCRMGRATHGGNRF